ncbi:MAG: YhfC family glutamic-type intramembrane protease [Chloroflexota bacterium]
MKNSLFTLLTGFLLLSVFLVGCAAELPNQSVESQLTPLIFLPGIGMILVGLGFMVYGVRKGGWKYSLLGALFWLGTVAVKFAFSIFANALIYRSITNALPELPGIIIFSLYIGLLTGVTEVLITWLVLRYTKLGKAVWSKALAFGVGFGAIEALLLGIGSLVGMIMAYTMQGQIPASVMPSILQANNIIYGLAPISERFFTIWIHIICSVLLFYGASNHQWRWFWISFAFKSAIDAVAGYAQVSGQLQSLAFMWLIEAIVIVFGVIGWWGTNRIQACYPVETEPATLVIEQHPEDTENSIDSDVR